MDLLNRKRSASYRVLYEESMQYATVTRDDLRQWLQEWREGGLIRYGNWGKNQRVPHSDTMIELIVILS
jgi:hypothetical protein